MGLAEDLDRVASFDTRTCRVYAAMVEHPDEADVIFEACTSDRRPATAVAKVLSRHGIPMSDTTVKRHRRRECRCPQMMPERYDVGAYGVVGR